MQIGMIGLGRMGGQMARRLMRGGHECVVYDRSEKVRESAEKDGAISADSITALADKLAPPRSIWLMVPAAIVQEMVDQLADVLEPGDIIIDGGNSFYRDDIRRAKQLWGRQIRFIDVGTSGGVRGGERGYCLMIGGPPDAVAHLDPIFATLAPGLNAAPRTPGRDTRPSTAEKGYLRCGKTGAGHFVKMVHNGIEYGLMAAYAEGLNILRHANAGSEKREVDAETTPLRHPEFFQYDFNLSDVAEVWRRGSVISSWLLDLTAQALLQEGDLERFTGRVSDSGEGRWTLEAAIEEGVPAPVLSVALGDRFTSRGRDEFADKVLSALRYEFGGHEEKHA
jgi:6-phosphogluconate dehydrogenase